MNGSIQELLERVIAGEVAGHQGPGITYTPIALLHATVAPGAQLRLPWRPDFNVLVYVLAGSGSVSVDWRPVRTGQLAIYGPGEVVTVAADTGQERRTPSSTSWSWAASPSESGWPPTARS